MIRKDRNQYLVKMGYDGARFFGVPPQQHGPTVASALTCRLEDAAGQRARALCFTARTDRGVHALENYATCWFVDPFDATGFERAMAVERDDGLTAVEAIPVDPHVHARNVSQGKWYRYRIRIDGREDDRALGIVDPLDVSAMGQMAAQFVGTHNFSAYRYRCSSPNTIKTLTRVEIIPKDGVLEIHFEGDGFLRWMIRKLVGTMIEVGLGQFSVEDGVALLKAGKSYGAPKAVAPAGLTLMAIRRKEE
jgi:tRNA pseudouridine38-40 synthase